ncbi:MAG TPA: MFS transporter [Anaeromyxobacteraceae bacterium]|nr:MFS transporter [Anaeromyxobacteraceae bacterium]
MTTFARADAAPRPWYAGLTGAHWRVLTASFLGWVFDGYEAYALVVALPLALRALLTAEQMKTPAIWGGTAIGVTLLGWGIGGIVGGTLSDYVGRKRMMIWSVALYGIFSGLTALAQSFLALALLRFVTGLAMGSEWSTGVAMVAETWPDRARPKGAGLLQSGFGWGTLLAAAVWWGLQRTQPLGAQSWRLVFVVGAIPALFTLYIRRAIDESEKWLSAVRERRWAATEVDRGAAGPAARRPLTIAEIFRQPESRRRVLLTFLLSLATMVGWWAISTWLPAYAGQLARAQGYADPAGWGTRAALLYTSGAVAAYLVAGFLIDAIGRRPFLLLTYAGALAVTPITYLWTHSVEALLVVAPVNGFFTLGLAYSWMAIYPAELFTSSVRSTAASVIFNGTRLVAWIFPIVAGAIIQGFGGIPRAAMTLGLVYLLGLVVPWFVPETRGRPLPE